MLPRFEIIARHRPVAVVGLPLAGATYAGTPGPQSHTCETPLVAPYGAIEVLLDSAPGTTTLTLSAAAGASLGVTLEGDVVSLSVSDGRGSSHHRSRRQGRTGAPPSRLALALTGTQLSALTFEDGSWVVRGRVELAGRVDTRDVGWLAGLRSSWASTAAVSGWSAGVFGQLGLRDVRLVTEADGSPFRESGSAFFTATSAGPGFFGTAHTSMWTLDQQGGIRHRADLFFQRVAGVGGYGDHATHVVRDGNRWLVATSTWADFPADKAARRDATVGITLSETTADLTQGHHLLTSRPLVVPTSHPSVGVWDPHLVRTESGGWLVGYVSAKKFFDFHPVLAAGPSLDELTLRGAATDRRATEGTTIIRLGEDWRVLASDGRGNVKGARGRFTVFDLELREIGALEAPYPTNIPWPSVLAPDPGRSGDDWSLVTFDGTPTGGRVAGYGTHGDVVVMRAAR